MVTESRDFVQRQAVAWLEQMNLAWELLRNNDSISREEFWSERNPYFGKLAKLYEDDFVTAKLNDESDLILHAEGPGTAGQAPRLNVVNWLSTRMERKLRTLVQAVLPMATDDAHAAAKELDLRFTGVAPGSLFMGFAVASNEPSLPGMEEGDAAALAVVRKAMQSLPMVSQFVTSTEVSQGILEALPDPALRDAAIVAAFEMSPTGRNGIDSLEISAPRSGVVASSLTQRDRVVLRNTAVQKPLMGQRRHGVFVGDLRALDLDLRRATLRNLGQGLSSLRCVLDVPLEMARGLLGTSVRVRGEYESTPEGRPRLMNVTSLEPHERQGKLDDTSR